MRGHTYTPPKTREYEELVAWTARLIAPFGPDSRLRVRITLHDGLADVEVVELDREARTKLRGDVDNYAKSIVDGLVKGGLIGDDRQIDELEVLR